MSSPPAVEDRRLLRVAQVDHDEAPTRPSQLPSARKQPAVSTRRHRATRHELHARTPVQPRAPGDDDRDGRHRQRGQAPAARSGSPWPRHTPAAEPSAAEEQQAARAEASTIVVFSRGPLVASWRNRAKVRKTAGRRRSRRPASRRCRGPAPAPAARTRPTGAGRGAGQRPAGSSPTRRPTQMARPGTASASGPTELKIPVYGGMPRATARRRRRTRPGPGSASPAMPCRA